MLGGGSDPDLRRAPSFRDGRLETQGYLLNNPAVRPSDLPQVVSLLTLSLMATDDVIIRRVQNTRDVIVSCRLAVLHDKNDILTEKFV